MGLDLSLTGTGVVILDRAGSPVHAETISCKFQGMERLAFIRGSVASLLSRHSPLLTCVEGYSFSSRQSHAHALGELGGVIRLLLHRNGFIYHDIPPSTLKKFVTGKGNAMKDEVMMNVYKRWGFEAKDNNQADAYGLARISLALEDEDDKLIAPQREVIKALEKK